VKAPAQSTGAGRLNEVVVTPECARFARVAMMFCISVVNVNQEEINITLPRLQEVWCDVDGDLGAPLDLFITELGRIGGSRGDGITPSEAV
jgi:hypothetical protein